MALRRDAHAAYWTITLWADETSMRQSMMSRAHRRVPPRALEWFNEAAIVHWFQAHPEMPTWEEAHRRLQREGRATKVKCPSQAHRQFVIAPPL